jgi:hypothetical protein
VLLLLLLLLLGLGVSVLLQQLAVLVAQQAHWLWLLPRLVTPEWHQAAAGAPAAAAAGTAGAQ